MVLVITGLYIGRPYFMAPASSASPFLMGWMRFIHFVAASVLVATGIVRVYWLFVGNKFERWRALFPVHREDWVNGWQVLKKYMLVFPQRAPHYMGHNPLQQISYTAIYAIVVIQVFTGFAMYGLSNPSGFFFVAFGWVNTLFGGVQVVHFVHHVLTWVFVIFLPIHVYLTIRVDLVHREARLSSIVSGGRFVRDDIEFVDD